MALTDFPTIKPTDTQVYLIALALATFIFFFTQPKVSDVEQF